MPENVEKGRKLRSTKRGIFLQNDGRHIHFFLKSCPERLALKPLIEKEGGRINGKQAEDSISLGVEGSRISEPCVSSKYVRDCIDEHKLLAQDPYRLTSKKNRLDTTNSSSTGSDLSDLSPGSNIITCEARSIMGRKKYTLSEDMKMIEYLIKERRFTHVGGNTVWKDMYMLEILHHSAQSMKDRYRNHIIPSIRQYPISPQWMSLLTGDLTIIADMSDTNKRVSPLRRIADKSVQSPADDDEMDLGLYKNAEIHKVNGIPENSKRRIRSLKRTLYSGDQVFMGDGDGKDDETCSDNHKRNDSSLSPTKQRLVSPSKQRHKTRHSVVSPAFCEDDGTITNSVELESASSTPGTNSSVDKVTTSKANHVNGGAVNKSSMNFQKNEALSKSPKTFPSTFSRVRKLKPIGEPGSSKDQSSDSQDDGIPIVTGVKRQKTSSSNENTDCDATPHGHRQAKAKKHKHGYKKYLYDSQDDASSEIEEKADDEAEERQALIEVIEDFCTDYNLTTNEAIRCLKANSGSVADTRHWLEYGSTRQGIPAWTAEDDAVIHSADQVKLQRLAQMYTISAIHARSAFLES